MRVDVIWVEAAIDAALADVVATEQFLSVRKGSISWKQISLVGAEATDAVAVAVPDTLVQAD